MPGFTNDVCDVKSADYDCILKRMSKIEAINLVQNVGLIKKKSRTLQKLCKLKMYYHV